MIITRTARGCGYVRNAQRYASDCGPCGQAAVCDNGDYNHNNEGTRYLKRQQKSCDIAIIVENNNYAALR